MLHNFAENQLMPQHQTIVKRYALKELSNVGL